MKKLCNVKMCLFFLVALIFPSGLQSSFNFSNQYATIRLKSANSKLILETPLSNYSGTLSLKDNSVNTISGSSVNFVDGILNTGPLSTIFTGDLDLASEKILLQGNASLDILTGTIDQPIDVTGINNSISGRLTINQPITLQDSSTNLGIGIQVPLGSSLILNSGTLTLNSDLTLGEGSMIVGPGIVNSQGFRLSLGSSPYVFDRNLTFVNDANIEMNAGVSLSNCTWNFSDVAGFSVINGNGNTLNIGMNGTISLASKHILVLNNVRLKGIGDGLNDGKIIFGDNDAIVIMTNVIIDQANDYTLSLGRIYMHETNCIVTIKSFLFNINGPAVLTIDGIALIWDKLASTDNSNPIIPAASSNLVLLNGGYIKSVNTTSQPTYIFSNSASITENIPVSTSGNVIAQNTNPLVPKSIHLSGNGNYISFTSGASSQSFIVEDNVALTLSNMTLKDFNPDSITLGTGATLELGDDTTIELSRDTYFSKPMRIIGNVTIVGNGCNLYLTNNDSLIVDAPSKTLVIQHVNLHNMADSGVAVPRLRVNYSSAGVVMRDTTLVLDNDYTFSGGFMNIEGIVKMTGQGKIFTYTSSAQSIISSNSMLLLDLGVTFSYAANVGTYPSSYQDSKTRLMLADSSSTLCLDGATLYSTHTGISLDIGTLLVKDHSVLKSVAGLEEGPYAHGAPSTGEEPEIGNQLTVKILSGAILDIQGKVMYD